MSTIPAGGYLNHRAKLLGAFDEIAPVHFLFASAFFRIDVVQTSRLRNIGFGLFPDSK
jgi:hypothetical protein